MVLEELKGVELRDPHPEPFPNEFYTKLYVFQLEKGKNATRDVYQWGKNQPLFERLDRMKRFSDTIFDDIQNVENQWLLLSHAFVHRCVVAWSIGNYLFVVNLDTLNAVENIKIPTPQYKSDFKAIELQFSTFEETENLYKYLKFNGLHIVLPKLEAGEGRVYKF